MEFALQRPEPGKWAAAVFSLLMHVILVAVLFYGVQWQRRAPQAVSVELVRSLPPAGAPEQPVEQPREVVPPRPVEVKPVEVKPAPVVKPDIAIKEPEKKKPVKKEEPKPEPPKVEKKPEAKPAEKKPEAPKMTDMDRLLAKEADKVAAVNTQNRLDREAADLRAKLDAAAATASMGRAEGDWIGQIAQKVKSNLMRPQGVTGNPVVEFRIELLPSGEVLGEPKIVKSSGNNAVDEAARRAILKSSPLPKPAKTEVFQREINLRFHPMSDRE